jgi:hypothetical protein|tara:strand:- start:449 stop:793 length:345 start_codon:yes stop_codon:yes gene_type:complete
MKIYKNKFKNSRRRYVRKKTKFELKCDKLLHESMMHDSGMLELNALLSLYTLKSNKAQAIKLERDRLQRLLNEASEDRDYAYSLLPADFITKCNEDAVVQRIDGKLVRLRDIVV